MSFIKNAVLVIFSLTLSYWLFGGALIDLFFT
jgi:hypothetical protein